MKKLIDGQPIIVQAGDTRTAFETWAQKEMGFAPGQFTANIDGDYFDEVVRHMWCAYAQGDQANKDAARWRAYTEAFERNDRVWLDRVANSLVALGLDDDATPTKTTMDKIIDDVIANNWNGDAS